MTVRCLVRTSAVTALVFAAAACGDDGDSTATPSPGGSELEDEVVVFAASSLTDAFEEIGAAFESAHPGTSVTFNFAASTSLQEQILAGAPADVFASASTSSMDTVVEAGAAADAEAFAENQLEIVVPTGNPGDVTGLSDFGDEDLLIGLCAEEVPCGTFGLEALDQAGVTPSVDTYEPDVRSLLTKVELGELDAGIVYVTDVLAAGDAVEGIELGPEENVVATYPVAPVTEAPNAAAANEFVSLVRSADGQEILESYGFDPVG